MLAHWCAEIEAGVATGRLSRTCRQVTLCSREALASRSLSDVKPRKPAQPSRPVLRLKRKRAGGQRPGRSSVKQPAVPRVARRAKL
jgi:hypothetical protein